MHTHTRTHTHIHACAHIAYSFVVLLLQQPLWHKLIKDYQEMDILVEGTYKPKCTTCLICSIQFINDDWYY